MLLSIVLLFLFTSFSAHRHSSALFEEVYNCIEYEKNIIGHGTDKFLFSFFNHLDHYIKTRMGKINIVHIGDSHIQADYLTAETRSLFQQTFGNGGRGFLFPFKIANTNNPINYSVSFGGRWNNCKAVQAGDGCNLGINGLVITTRDSNSFILIDPDRIGKTDYSYNSLKLFYKTDGESFSPVFYNKTDKDFFFDEQPVEDGYSQFFFNKPQDSVILKLSKSFPGQNNFQFYGMSLENNNPGLLYHAIGLNGAFTKSFNKSTFFTKQLRALEPDLVIVSLGTNDNFQPESRYCIYCIKDNLRTLLDNVRASKPGVSILLVTPGDFYMKNGTHSNNNDTYRTALYELAEEYNCGIWDFNEVMGGNYSIKCWTKQGLARTDYIHYSRKGYEVQGQLLYRAIMDAYEKRFN
ncbi:MAG: GDSL-type esterase/lipase family protein [Bacteroidia bacterium]